MNRNERIKEIADNIYSDYITNGWKNVSLKDCELKAINYIDTEVIVKKGTKKTKEMSEATHQKKIIKNLEKEGYYVLKLISTNKTGIPDILALKPNDIKFVEVKGVKTPVSELQKYRLKELINLGFDATIDRE